MKTKSRRPCQRHDENRNHNHKLQLRELNLPLMRRNILSLAYWSGLGATPRVHMYVRQLAPASFFNEKPNNKSNAKTLTTTTTTMSCNCVI
jgi:hypothetical protein